MWRSDEGAQLRGRRRARRRRGGSSPIPQARSELCRSPHATRPAAAGSPAPPAGGAGLGCSSESSVTPRRRR